MVVIYKHIVRFTYSQSYCKLCSIAEDTPDGLVSCIHSCKVLSSIYKSIEFLTSFSYTSINILSSIPYYIRSSEVEHIICIKDTARLLTSLFDFMPCVHTQLSQTHIHLPFRVIHSNLDSIIRTNSCLVINTAGGIEYLSSAISIATSPIILTVLCSRKTNIEPHYTHVTDITISICGNLMMLGTATHRVIHCVSS